MNDERPKTFPEICHYILSQYVQHPEALAVSATEKAAGHHIIVRGHMADQSRVIGAQARNVVALQTVMGAIGTRLNQAVSVHVLEPSTGTPQNVQPYAPDLKWDGVKDLQLVAVLREILLHIYGHEPKISVTPIGDRSRLSVEIEDMDPSIEGSLNTLFRAIGRSLGRIVSVHASQNKSFARVAGAGNPAGQTD